MACESATSSSAKLGSKLPASWSSTTVRSNPRRLGLRGNRALPRNNYPVWLSGVRVQHDLLSCQSHARIGRAVAAAALY